MADISMCNQHMCPRAKECYRHEAKPSHYQSYILPNWTIDKCDHYWPMHEKTSSSNTEERKAADE